MSIRIITAVSALAILAGCTQSIEDPAQSPAYIAAALGYDAYKQGDLLTAENQFETALSAEPDNPYALLGLGAVRENSGDFTGARQLYTAARGTGVDAQANYTYITEQRLERVANVNVASLAEENLARLTIRQASITPPTTTGFVSYDSELAVVTDQVAYTAPIPASVTTTTEGGNYQPVGSYESYVASVGGSANTVYTEPAYIEPAYVEPAYVEPLDTTSYDQPTLGMIEPALDIVPASYDSTPYYEAPLSYDDVAVPAQYEPVANIAPAYTSPAPVASFAPSNGLLEYGQAFGDPVDLVAAPVMQKDAATPMQADGLIFLGDG